MPFYEIITEPGSHMIAEYADDTEAARAISTQHQRATTGDQGGPTGHPGERIVKVLKYEVHPADYAQEGVVPVQDLQPLIEAHTKDGLLNVNTFAAALRDQLSPLTNDPNAKRHDSMYVMPESSVLDSTTWQTGGESNAG